MDCQPKTSRNMTFRENYFSTTSLQSLQKKEMNADMLKLRGKVDYEWKNIYKQLLAKDTQRKMQINREVFEKVLTQLKVYISREDIKQMCAMTTGSDDVINYGSLADIMHLPKIFDGGQTAKYLERVSKMKMKMKTNYTAV